MKNKKRKAKESEVLSVCAIRSFYLEAFNLSIDYSLSGLACGADAVTNQC